MQDLVSEADIAGVAQLYDSPEGQLGPLLFGGNLHWGYWDEDNREDDFPGGADRLAQIMIDRVEIQPGQRFCDLGCGVGVSAIKLAQAKGCQVDGITISQFQQEDATKRAQVAGLQHQLNFIHGNALSFPCADHSYDGGWFFESIFHMGQRQALLEASRILKPGALLLLTDLPTLPNTTDEFRQFVREHLHSSFVAKADYSGLLAETGFELVELLDITPYVMVPLVPKFKAVLDVHKADILAGGLTEKAIDDWVYAFEYMSENLGYMLVSARKM